MSVRRTFRTEKELFHADTCEPLKQGVAGGNLTMEALGRGTYPGERLPRNELIGLCMAGYWSASAPQEWGLDWHRNEGIEIGYVSAGTLPFGIDGQSMEVPPGALTITRPWQRHRVGNPRVPACHYSWVILDVGVRRPNQPWRWPRWILSPKPELEKLTAMLRQNETPVWQGNRRIAECFCRLDETVGLGNSVPNLTLLKLAINELILRLTDLLQESNPQLDSSLHGSARTVDVFLRSLEERLDEPWTLECMARECGLGRTQFANLCHKAVNLSPVEYLIQRRLAYAATLLCQQPAMAITEIAFRCGFQSSQHFANSFRQQHGCTPRHYRKRI